MLASDHRMFIAVTYNFSESLGKLVSYFSASFKHICMYNTTRCGGNIYVYIVFKGHGIDLAQ